MKNLYIFVFVLFIGHFCFAENIIPAKSRQNRADFLDPYIKEGAVGAEIGVAGGSFSYHFLLPKNPKKLFLIDPWTDAGIPRTIDQSKDALLNFQTKMYQYVAKLFEEYPNVEVVRMTSDDAVVLFEDNYFDYVYIDGEHSYRAVYCDLTNYYSKVKPGGYLIGDDYGWRGVKPAVRDFLNLYKDKCKFVDAKAGQFVIRKIR